MRFRRVFPLLSRRRRHPSRKWTADHFRVGTYLRTTLFLPAICGPASCSQTCWNRLCMTETTPSPNPCRARAAQTAMGRAPRLSPVCNFGPPCAVRLPFSASSSPIRSRVRPRSRLLDALSGDVLVTLEHLRYWRILCRAYLASTSSQKAVLLVPRCAFEVFYRDTRRSSDLRPIKLSLPTYRAVPGSSRSRVQATQVVLSVPANTKNRCSY